MKPPNTVQT